MSPALGSVSDALGVDDAVYVEDESDAGDDDEDEDSREEGWRWRSGGRGVYRRAICSCGCFISMLQIDVEKRWA